MSEMQELKACPSPWCGEKQSVAKVRDVPKPTFRVICKCGVMGPMALTEAKAITAWNTRPAALERQASPNETGWLIERRNVRGEAQWLESWIGFNDSGPEEWIDADRWTKDSLKAIRFARKEDAERVIKVFEWPGTSATEHMWVQPRTKTSSQTSQTSDVSNQASPGGVEEICGILLDVLKPSWDRLEAHGAAAQALVAAGYVKAPSVEEMAQWLTDFLPLGYSDFTDADRARDEAQAILNRMRGVG